MTVFRALRNRTFAALWLGQTLSRIGDFTYELALAWWVLKKTGSPQATSLVLIFALTPSVLFSLLGGVAADKFARAWLMLGSDIARGVVALAVALLSASGRLEVSHLYVASLLFGFLDAFFQPAYAALVPQLISEDERPSATALTGISMSLGRIAGPAIGAGLVAALGPTLAFSINAVTFFVSSLLLLPALGVRLPKAAIPHEAPLWQSLGEGFRTVRRQRWLWVSIVLFALTNITLVAPYCVCMPYLVTQVRHAGVGTLGILYAAFPLGYLLGGLWLGRLPRLRRRGLVMHGAMALAATMLALLGTRLPLPVLLVAALINGVALEANNLAWMGLLQEKIPPEQQGRVFSIDAMGSLALLPLGLALVGWGAVVLGPDKIFLLGGSVTTLLSLFVLVSVPSLRQLD
ncbi:MFS transporter [Armatimonas rosea]|uniref:MFS family permease n=1 Tax=Armatimonas rosea TaxID=685828 RepID=A0A7W9W9N9_ARMRO|nr:MFS family permease [Armatimonas rosea]